MSNKKPRFKRPSTVGSVRIIAGRYKRRKLSIAANNDLPSDFRPTPDRLRETVFNWLGQSMHGWHCVDACAGSGALGFEAVSRGANSVYMIEDHAGAVAQLQKNKARLQAHSVHIQLGDVLVYLKQLAQLKPAYFNVIFLDPPYDSNIYKPALQAIASMLAPSGYVYLEARHEWSSEALEQLGWQRWRYTRAGVAHAHLLRFLT